jgi:dephospho-CoA kinase
LKKIGLTGGIGSGKSYVAKIFEALEVPVFYADSEAKKILNQPHVITEVEQVLKTNILDVESGLPDRKKIASIVFNAPEKLKLLNQIIHPKVEQNFILWCQSKKFKKYVIKEAAILFESGSYKNLDGVICVVAPIEVRIKRVAQRDQTTEEEIRRRIDQQMKDEERISKSNWIINNPENSAILAQVIDIHQNLIKD